VRFSLLPWPAALMSYRTMGRQLLSWQQPPTKRADNSDERTIIQYFLTSADPDVSCPHFAVKKIVPA
jgi:hypothetical protein